MQKGGTLLRAFGYNEEGGNVMRVCFVSGQTLKDFSLISQTQGAELYLFGFRAFGEVSYERELKGETEYFENAAKLSKEQHATVVVGCLTDAKGIKRKSAVVAEKGRILGVSDMVNVIDEEVNCGAEIRLFDTAIGRMGVLVADDLLFYETVQALCLCGCDFIVCPYEESMDSTQSLMARAYAFACGVPIFFCGVGHAFLANPQGELEFSCPLSPFVFEYVIRKEYRLISTRKKGYRKQVLQL